MGVLALQGAVAAHLRALEACGAQAFPVRGAAELEAAEAFIIPGGESTTMVHLLKRLDLMDALRHRIRSGMPTWGTCAGLILLADRLVEDRPETIGGLDVLVRRNAYGTQVASFEGPLAAPELGAPFWGVFIRAPRIEAVGPGVDVLARRGDEPVAVRQKHLMGTAFHPELTPDLRLHRYFLGMKRGSSESPG